VSAGAVKHKKRRLYSQKPPLVIFKHGKPLPVCGFFYMPQSSYKTICELYNLSVRFTDPLIFTVGTVK
jgi:hypothetical protein